MLQAVFKNALLRRVLLFVFLFIIVSGAVGYWIIGTKLLYGFYFFIYGNLGKLVIFSFILFGLLTRNTIHTLKASPMTNQNKIFLVSAFILLGTFYLLRNSLLGYASFAQNPGLAVLVHLNLIAVCVALLIGSFGMPFLKTFVRKYRRELLICSGLSIVLFFLIFQVWKLWPYLSNMVLQAEYFLFSKLYEPVFIIPPRGLYVHSFAVEIAEACSGLESIFLFTVLYIFMVILDWKKLNLKKVIIAFPILMVLLILVNILRVFVLILSGIHINPQVMMTLFHTYLGLILFVIFFFLFMKYVYPLLRK